MPTSKQTISSFLSKAFVVFLYISFLGVQLFFNFDTGKGPTTTVHYYSSNSNTKNSSPLPCIKRINKNGSKQVTVLLNKRFQPESILVLNTIQIKTPVCYIEKANTYLPFDQFIPTSNILARSLRGPPAIA
ncbi:MAG TPA: hypothetical protein VK705_07945 [Ferruginibacter sp.]|nr:hypothetical protein [Ferruginibacter sp.]